MASAGSEPGAGPATSVPNPANASSPGSTDAPEKPTSPSPTNGPPGQPPAKTSTDESAKPTSQQEKAPAMPMAVELDDFGLPIRPVRPVTAPPPTAPSDSGQSVDEKPPGHQRSVSSRPSTRGSSRAPTPAGHNDSAGSDSEFVDAVAMQAEDDMDMDGPLTPMPTEFQKTSAESEDGAASSKPRPDTVTSSTSYAAAPKPRSDTVASNTSGAAAPEPISNTVTSKTSGPAQVVSEFSHQQAVNPTTDDSKEQHADEEWQEMPAFARFDMYDDNDKLIAKERNEEEEDDDDEKNGNGNRGGAGKGYTRVIMDDDAESATSMDDNTQYLFKNVHSTSAMDEDDAEQRDAVSQMQATKDLLTEGQRIAYVGVVRLELYAMVKELEDIEHTRRTKKWLSFAAEAMKMLSQKMMIRLYAHMDISPAEQIMIEQLAEHGVVPSDLTPILMANSRVNNPMAEESPRSSVGGGSMRKDSVGEEGPAPVYSSTSPDEGVPASSPVSPDEGVPASSRISPDDEVPAQPPPPYEENPESLPDVRTPSQLPSSSKLDIDLRWTVLCDLFLVLIADSSYDARSRCLLERVAKGMKIPWIDICRFEKRVTDAIEMQQAAELENWNEDDHMEDRRKMALKRRYMMMGLATVGGGLVIGLSAGLLAPMIGAGLAAGFTTIGVGGTSSFLAGAGGAAVITSSAAASGSIIGGRAAGRRTGAVKTFEYRPLHNNKRVNLIITVSGWMTGKVDDVRLPYSTVDSIMGDIYSVLWEPELLRSMGDTMNILATEVSWSHR
ncbi:DUF726 domain-containing protein, partial [Candidatus Bathyarchaeota archaeon]|nr:DUF726 domain-containing protein [Candidatus Bathyarchaeota archaeon]